ncbi:hypothetical protein BDV93DRAFT_300516 [Ceratobasidium sp. AG-I]|nr:hypothetical protein BDV93DRAFT_300516 [Ceratobasidium sp. AG-I]
MRRHMHWPSPLYITLLCSVQPWVSGLSAVCYMFSTSSSISLFRSTPVLFGHFDSSNTPVFHHIHTVFYSGHHLVWSPHIYPSLSPTACGHMSIT